MQRWDWEEESTSISANSVLDDGIAVLGDEAVDAPNDGGDRKYEVWGVEWN